MKQLKYWGLASVVAMMMASCADDAIPGARDSQGCISLAVELNTEVVSSRQSRAQASSIDANDLHLTLVSTDGQKTYDLGTLGDYDASKKFPVGSYILHAEYGDENAQGFDTPYYKGQSEAVRVVEGETVQVGLAAKLANSMVTVTYSDALKKYLSDYSAELQTAGNSPVAYAADEVRPLYVKPGKVDLYVNVTKPSGVSARMLAATVTAEPRHHYYVTVDVNDGEVGEGALVITFDDNLEAEEVTIDLSDELLNAPAPEVTASVTDPIDYVETTVNTVAAKYNIIARGYLSQVKLETTNAAAIDPAWPESIELMSADAETQQTLKALGINVLGLWNKPDKMAVVDLTDVISNITANGQSVKFALTAIDKVGKASDPVEIAVNVVPMHFEIDEIGDLYFGATSFQFTLNYNGDDPSLVTYKYKNERGTWTEVTPTSVTDNGDNTFTVVLPTPAGDDDFVFYATNGKSTTDEITVQRTPSKTYAPNLKDAYARKAIIAVTETAEPTVGALYGKYATLYLSTDGADYTQADIEVVNGYVVASGLTAGTHYYAKVSLTADVDDSKAFEFDTEEAVQLPNYQMENWAQEQPTTKYQIVYYPGESKTDAKWGTRNLLTTSERGTGTSMFSYGGTSYRAFSGTRPSTDKHQGTNAAVIETVGWGKGNTAAGTTAGTCQHITPGELYLGAENSGNLSGDPAYGMEFGSRPASLTFFYKYTAKNSADYGLALIKVYDAEGNVLAEASKQLTAAGSYTEETLDLDYAFDAAKAAKIDVRFKSSDNASCLQYNSSNVSVPAFGNYTDGRYTGSSLYIDDITLNY